MNPVPATKKHFEKSRGFYFGKISSIFNFINRLLAHSFQEKFHTL
jgi:hypothetical protein